MLFNTYILIGRISLKILTLSIAEQPTITECAVNAHSHVARKLRQDRVSETRIRRLRDRQSTQIPLPGLQSYCEALNWSVVMIIFTISRQAWSS
jgi:hypothetical protein